MFFLREALGKVLLRVFDRLLSLLIFMQWWDASSRSSPQRMLKIISLVARKTYYCYRQGQKSVCLALERRLPDLKEGKISPGELVAVLRSEAPPLAIPSSPWQKEEHHRGQEDVLLSIWALLEAGCLGPLSSYYSRTVRENHIRRARSCAHSCARDCRRLHFLPPFAISKAPS